MNELTRDTLLNLVARVKRVRKWLILLAMLKVAALSLVFVSLYIAVYAWLDHKFHFGHDGRLAALALMICGAIAMLFPLARFLIRHISCSQAANYIERNRTFNQQLVAAVEYYENEDDYPYSRTLAERLVLQTAKDTAEFDFDWTVPKWQAYMFSAVAVVGMSVAGFFLHDNYVFFSSYFSRLVRPTAAIAPLPPTSLESVTGDMRVDPGVIVTLAASIRGQVPEQGAFILGADPNNEGDAEPLEALRLRPLQDDSGDARFEISIPMEKAGKYKYRFEAAEAVSASHEILVCNIPKINKIIASVKPANSKVGPAYTEEIEDHTIEVTEDSVVTLHIEASAPLQKVQISDPVGKKTILKPVDTNDFDFTFTAEKEGFLELAVTSSEGVDNNDIPALQVLVKRDEPPTFKLLTPGGDYMATNVSSVPIRFEVTDDFGLNSAVVCFEIAGRQQPMSANFPVKRGSKNHILSCTLEMEEYNLGVGDSIIMYAEAADIDIATEAVKHTATSDIYFIEIRPYRQVWHQRVPREPRPGSPPPPSEGFELLIRILEYTRAIVKKTWSIANKPEEMAPAAFPFGDKPAGLSDQQRSQLDSIRKDVLYCREQLANYTNLLGEAAKPTVEKTLQEYEAAASQLASHDAGSALVHEKEAYRLLRILVVEIHKLLNEPGAGGAYPKERDRVVIDEDVHLTRYEKERIEWELQELADRLNEARQQQEGIRDEFEKFLAKQEKHKLPKQEVTDERSWTSNEFWPAGGQSENRPGEQGPPPDQSMPSVEGGLKPPSVPSPASGGGQTPQQWQPEKSDQQTGEQEKRNSGDYDKSDSQGAGQGQSGQQAEGPNQSSQGQASGSQGAGEKGQGSGGQGKGNAASNEEMMKMLSAKQKLLQQRIAELQQQLGDIREISKADKAARKEANKRIDAAQAKMDEFQERIGQAYYEAGSGDGNLNLALLALEVAAQELELARSALEGDIVMTTGDVDPLKAEELAEEMAEIADALDRSVSPAESAQMLARLQQANALLQSMSPNPQNTSQGGPVNRGPGSQTGSAPGGGADRLGQTSPVITKDAPAPSEEARAMARQFWSVAIKAKRQQGRFIDDEPSDARFYEKENDFFEEAAKADSAMGKK